ncbi:MAG: hypothetical protein QF681_16950 [Vicinamibacterales bacterium]|mgnify:FL=1|jgi:hypothetical protein|nr:hypothetical protein [Vicinamibacterales bacterium]
MPVGGCGFSPVDLSTAGDNHPMVMWVLDTQTGDVAAYTVERESGQQSVLDRLEVVQLVHRRQSDQQTRAVCQWTSVG